MKKILAKLHNNQANRDYPERKHYPENDYDKPYVFFANYDMVQSNIVILAKNSPFDVNLIPVSRLFNEYYGGGMSSIVFQEIREGKGLAYSAYAGYSVAYYPDEYNYVFGFVGTQPDKMEIATNAMLDLLDSMPKVQKHFQNARESLLKKIESERITKANIYWSYLRNLDRGIDYDFREKIYKYAKESNIDNLKEFFDSHIRGRNYIFLVIADKKKVNWNILKKLGEVKEIPLDVLLNY